MTQTPPQYWYCFLGNCTEEQLIKANQWRINQVGCRCVDYNLQSKDTLFNFHYDKSYFSGNDIFRIGISDIVLGDTVEITFDQFENWFLNKPTTKEMSHPTNEQILEVANTSPEAIPALSKLYPELFPVNRSVKIKDEFKICDENNNIILTRRNCGNHDGISFYLNEDTFDFEIIKDNAGMKILVPTYKQEQNENN